MFDANKNHSSLALIPQIYWEFSDGGGVRIYEASGELTEEEEMEYKEIIGDGMGSLSSSVGFSLKHYGDGTSVTITAKMTCDQSEKGFEDAAILSRSLSERFAMEAIKDAQSIFENLSRGER